MRFPLNVVDGQTDIRTDHREFHGTDICIYRVASLLTRNIRTKNWFLRTKKSISVHIKSSGFQLFNDVINQILLWYDILKYFDSRFSIFFHFSFLHLISYALLLWMLLPKYIASIVQFIFFRLCICNNFFLWESFWKHF